MDIKMRRLFINPRCSVKYVLLRPLLVTVLWWVLLLFQQHNLSGISKRHIVYHSHTKVSQLLLRSMTEASAKAKSSLLKSPSLTASPPRRSCPLATTAASRPTWPWDGRGQPTSPSTHPSTPWTQYQRKPWWQHDKQCTVVVKRNTVSYLF